MRVLKFPFLCSFVLAFGFFHVQGIALFSSETNQAPRAALFIDVAQFLGLSTKNVSGSAEKRFILESLGSGAAWLDYDGDEDLDLYVINGSTLEAPGRTANVLYRNDGQAGFTDVTASARVGDTSWGFGVTVGDYDNDGDPDIFVSNFGPNILYRNNGDGTFTDVTEAVGLTDDHRWSTSCAFGDYDNDGWLDLYVVNYLAFNAQSMDLNKGPCIWKGRPVMCGPEGFPPESDLLYRNNGDGTFTNVSVSSGITVKQTYGLGVVFGDYDSDGDSDIFVANDSHPNLLFQNNGDGSFTEIGLVAGVALSEDGREQAGMGIDLGDWNNDGYQDLFITNFSNDYNSLYTNQGNGLFQDESVISGLAWPSFYTLGWGAFFFDADNDGDLDVFVANSHVYPQVDQLDASGRQGDSLTNYPQENHLFLNQLNEGRLAFEKVESISSSALGQIRRSRAAAFGDFNDDGLMDILVTNENDTVTLLQGNGGKSNSWLKVRLVGTKSNRDGIGALVIIKYGDIRQVREVRSGASYLSSNDIRPHFGLGQLPLTATVGELEIKWPSGTMQRFEDVKPNRIVTIDETRGIVKSVPGRPRSLLSSIPPPNRELRKEKENRKSDVQTVRKPVSWAGLQRHLTSLLDRAGRAFSVGQYEEAAAAYHLAIISLTSVDEENWQYPAAALWIFDKATYKQTLAKIYDNLGVALFRLRRFREAESNIKSALALDPQNSKFFANLGVCYFHWKRFAEAAELFSRVVTLNPHHAKYHYHLGRTLTEIGNYDEAQKALTSALKLTSKPDYEGIRADCFYYIGLGYFRQRQLDYAIGFFYQTLREASGHQEARYKLARLLIELGNQAEAMAHLAELRRTNPIIEKINDLIHSRPLGIQDEARLAELYASAKLFSSAIRVYKRLLSIFPEDAKVRFELAKLYLKYSEGGRVDAIQELEYALKLKPDDQEARKLLNSLHTIASQVE